MPGSSRECPAAMTELDLDHEAAKIRALAGITGKRTPPLIDDAGAMRCQRCRKAFSNGEAVFQTRHGDGIHTLCEQCRWPSDCWISHPCDNRDCRRPIHREIRHGQLGWIGFFKACSKRCRKVIHGHVASVRREESLEPILYTCKACGTTFVPKRSDAITCTGRCRVKLHRQRHRNGWQMPKVLGFSSAP
jgi:hypothetical protein